MSVLQFSEGREDESILIVNDAPEQLLLMHGVLRKAGYSVFTAEDGESAFNLAKQHQPDLVISDVCMPGISGLDFCRLLRADNELRAVPILLVSALLNDTASLVQGLRAGADDYLEVPFDSTRLIAKVARLIERSRLETLYRDLVEQANDLIFTQDLAGRITSINNAAASFVGRNPQDLIGKLLSSVFGILGLDPKHNGFTSYFNGATPGEFKHQFNLKDLSGEDRWLDLTISPLRDKANHITGFRGLARDITERKQAELALRESEERYRLLFESIPQPIWVYDEETLKFLPVNDAATVTYGYTRDEFLSMTINDIVAPLNSDEAFGEAVFGASQHRTKNNRTLYVELTSHPVVFDGKNSMLVNVNDVTERNLIDQEQQRLHASLQQSAQEWRQTFDAMDFPVLIVDLQGRIRRFNYSTEQLLGTNAAAIAGRRVSDLGALQPWKKASELIENLRLTNNAASEEVHDERTGKTWLIAVFFVSEFGALSERAILLAQDITKRVELENSLRESKMMSLLGSVVAGVAHEVRNPLFALSSNLDAFEKRFSDRTEYKRYTDILRSEIERLSVLMEDLLEYGKPFISDLYMASMSEMIERSIRSCVPAAEAAQVVLVNDVDKALPRIWVDRRRISTVFNNLIENAIQHSPSGGEVRVQGRLVSENDQDWVECVIKDCGSGIQPEDMAKIFEPFFSKRRGGTGLGLAIAQKTMEQHRGKLLATNNPDGGASMIARFPLAAEVSVHG
jgi:PAS domain S-box-containing protein